VEVPLKAIQVEPVVIHADARGQLCKVHPGPVSGEVYTVEVRPGDSRGHHFHTQMGEWFTALAGKGIVVVEHPQTGWREQAELKGQRVHVPAGWAHALFNTGTKKLWVLACAEGAHDPADVHPFPVSAPQ
jgi:oxalate decarboxylase/phosphoglucose isomerase-like protein (cupin superfamily)